MSSDRFGNTDYYLLTFEIPGFNGENLYGVNVDEYCNGIGFEYEFDQRDSEKLEEIAPLYAIQQLADIASRALNDTKTQPEKLILSINDDTLLKDGNYIFKSIVGKEKVAVIKFDFFDFNAKTLDYWKTVIWHEVMHIKYFLEKRFPTIYPVYYTDFFDEGPLWAFDSLLDFSIDGWLKKHGKPVLKTDFDLKQYRISQFKKLLEKHGYFIDVDLIRNIANDLWGKETNIWEIWEIMKEIGLDFNNDSPIGRYLQQYSQTSNSTEIS